MEHHVQFAFHSITEATLCWSVKQKSHNVEILLPKVYKLFFVSFFFLRFT